MGFIGGERAAGEKGGGFKLELGSCDGGGGCDGGGDLFFGGEGLGLEGEGEGRGGGLMAGGGEGGEA